MADPRNTAEQRPSPDALLEAAQREQRRAGALRIFVGAAPGVGKTYAMLETARARSRDGYDVVVGVVETHGRRETEALLDGLEIVPRRRSAYAQHALDEMDLDAVLRRKPQIVLVDELAHTNAPGSRHPKRYLDVEELLANGIDVYSTVNIQHIESLNDVVAQITRVRVRETIPDAIFDRADAVELVDITPGDLIERLKDGKIYVPQQAVRALEHFFSPANLTALRELALRRTAERVDDQLLAEMRTHAISGPWPAGERVLVCVSHDSVASGLVRYAKRLADRLHAPWTALYVEGRRSVRLSEADRDRVADTLRFAESLGGEAVTVPGGGRIAEDVVAYSRGANVTQIVIGKSHRSRWFELINGSVVHELVRRSGNISVHVISGEVGEPVRRVQTRTVVAWSLDPFPFAVAAVAVAVALAVGKLVEPWVGVESIDLVFLAAVVGVAVRFGLGPSLLASVAASLAYNFFFLPPLYTFTIADPTNVTAFVFLTLIAVIVSNIGSRVRTQAVAALARSRATQSLYAFSRKLAGAGSLDDVLWATAYQTALMLRVRVVLLVPEDGTLVVKTGYPPEDALDEADLAAAKWAWESNRPAGRGSDSLPGAKRLFLPMRTGRGAVGIVGIDSDKAGPLFTPDDRRLLDALIDQGALAIERVHLVADVERVRRNVESERLRAAMLTSLSHDLKTPLAAVLGSATALRDLGGKLSASEHAELLQTIIDEAERLNRFIANLLDMTRLESGAIVPRLGLYDLREAVGAALRRAERILTDHRVALEQASELPMVAIDPVLFEQALFNLLDNAAKYSPPSTTVTIRTVRDGDQEIIEVMDEGDGIAPADVERIFDKFYRTTKKDQVRAGTGLGLAIARGFVEAMHGTVFAGNRPGRRGAIFTIRLPIVAPQPALEAAE